MLHNEPNTSLINFDDKGFFVENNTGKNGKRYFVSPESNITGKSVVVEEVPLVPLVSGEAHTYTPSNLTDFLKAFLGRSISVFLYNEQSTRSGILAVVGDNFIVLQPKMHAELTVFKLNSISCIDLHS
jgi:hypothetical protein